MKVEINVPNSWKDLTIKKFQQFEKLQAQNLPAKDKTIKTVSLLCDVEESLLKRLKLSEVEEIAKELNKLDASKPLEVEMSTIIKHKGKKYGLIPNMSEMTTGEFIDLETFIQDGVIKNLHTIMSILYRPIIGKVTIAGQYEVEDYNPTQQKEDDMLDVAMDVALGTVNFFFRLELILLSDLTNYLNSQKTKTAKA